jgi:hypothetical protein
MVPNLRTRLTESGALNSRVSPDDRAFSLAQSVVTSLDRSSDMLAERSNEETKRWLFPWLARYRAIAEQSGRRFDPRDQRSIDEEGGEPEADVDSTAGGDFSDAANEDAANWATLDRQLLQLSGRFFDAETPLPKLLFSHDRLSGFDLQSVVRLEDVNRLPPIETVYQPSESLGSTMINALTLAMIAAVAILLWPFRGRWKSAVHSPAVWLFLLATTGMLFTPWWLVGPLLLAVVILPLIPRMLPRSLRWR